MSKRIIERIRKSGLTIYDSPETSRHLFLENKDLERILNRALKGSVLDYPIRTRSKVLKSMVCEALGYPVPESFKKTQPRFPGQNFDTYVQKSNNLQIWNEEISASRRYVLIRVNSENLVTKVKVVSGETLAEYDTTGTLTQKYQAKSRRPVKSSVLVSKTDTRNVIKRSLNTSTKGFLPIKKLYKKLTALTGTTIPNLGKDQERNRGAFLHKAICQCLGQSSFADTGQFPDIPDQLLEVKLQTSPTIDLGLVCPDSTERVSDHPEFRHRDIRYVVFYGNVEGENISLDSLVLTTGADFFSFFQRFEGKILNRKLQIPLPADFFD